MTEVRGLKAEGAEVGRRNAEVGNFKQAAIEALRNPKALNTFPLFNYSTN
jgi:hypothetical protein